MAEKLIIIGSGPAAWTAAIYASRANLEPHVYEGVASTNMLPGGQLMFTTELENYPGFPSGIMGPELMENIKKQALRFGTRVHSSEIINLDVQQHPFLLLDSNNKKSYALSVIVATGAGANWLGLENEQRLLKQGGGVSGCAICDGALPMYRNQKLAIVGGGDTAMEEALFLTKFSSEVIVIHRRDQFRASQIMQKRVLEHAKIKVIWNSSVIDILGQEKIQAIKIQNNQNKTIQVLPVGGLFIAIGRTPSVKFLNGKLDCDEKNYIKVTNGSHTSVEGVFAAGDVMDPHYRQAIVSAGMGCMAALDAERWLMSQNHLK